MKTAKEMPVGLRMYQEIPYIKDNNGDLKTNCPFHKPLEIEMRGVVRTYHVKVGDRVCRCCCSYNLDNDIANKIVKCTYIEED